ncbi:MAG TPA: hypothetical protein PKA41_16460 [Verrucomicrobiota bacterium]|nr:hypothetical protein [Verrucomicrobiota bacterium]
MKSVLSILCVLLLVGCSDSETIVKSSPLRFEWPSNDSFEVTEIILKQGNQMEIHFKCQIVETNQEFILRWLDAEILSFNGEKVSESLALQHELAPVQPLFKFPPFRISATGEFLEVIGLQTAMEESNQQLDKIAPERPKESREFFQNFGETDAGKALLNKTYGKIWETWVGLWTDLNIAEGETISDEVMMPFGYEDHIPAKVAFRNLGAVKTNRNLLKLEYKEQLTANNVGSAINRFTDRLAQETEMRTAEPLAEDGSFERLTTIDVHTDHRTLKPHWARRLVVTTVSVPGEENLTETESHEYRFHWR